MGVNETFISTFGYYRWAKIELSVTSSALSISLSPRSINVSVGQSFTITNSTTGGVKPYTFDSYSYTCLQNSPCNSTYLKSVRNGNTFTFTQNGSYYINLCVANSGSPTSVCAYTYVIVGSGGTTVPSPTISLSPSSVNVSVGQSFTITNTTTGGVKPYVFSNYSYTCIGNSLCSRAYLNGTKWWGNNFAFLLPGSYYINLCVASSGSSTYICGNTKVTVTAPPNYLVVLDSQANAAASLVTIGNQYHNTVSAQVISAYSVTIPLGGIVEAFGSSRVLIAQAAHSSNYSIVTLASFFDNLLMAANSVKGGSLSFNNVPLISAAGLPVAQVVVGANATYDEVEAADLISSRILNLSSVAATIPTSTTVTTTSLSTSFTSVTTSATTTLRNTTVPSTTVPTTTIVQAYTSYTITFRKGWNAFSLPLSRVTSISNGTCSRSSVASPPWEFVNGQYVQATSFAGGVGYWLKMDAQCSVTFYGPALGASQLPSLTQGWNFIGALNYSTAFNNIAGTCSATSGPWGFNATSNSYYNATLISPGNGYFVRVASACSLGTSASLPPPPP